MCCPECGAPSSTGPRLRPYCSVGCRNKGSDGFREKTERQLVERCAKVGELVEHDGVLCKIVGIQQLHQAKGAGFAKRHSYDHTWSTACGAVLEYPPAVAAPAPTCIACLAHSGRAAVVVIRPE